MTPRLGADPDHLRAPRHGDLDPLAEGMKSGIKGSELVVFEDCAHAPIYENVAAFNARSLDFLKRQAG